MTIFISNPKKKAKTMYSKKKTRLYICELLEDPAVSYPSYYSLSSTMHSNEMLHCAIIALHSFDFEYYEIAKSYEDIFAMLDSGTFPIYKEKYIVGYFGNKLMYLESNGWKGMPSTQDLFKMENWLVC
ncbi:MAG: hypothetical protein Q9M36_12415 [Sulfurovum sp.]|nr:hypothetical protein [Sulfurovum sp.]